MMRRLYRALLHLYPASFRQEHGAAMLDAFARESEGFAGPLRAPRILLYAVADVLPNAIGEHVELLRRDLRHAGRIARRSPGFYASLTAVMALGIGANAAVFSILQAVLLRPLPYRDAADVVMVWTAQPVPNDPLLTRDDRFAFSHRVLTPEQVIAIREDSRDALEDLASVRTWQTSLDAQMDLQLGDRTERLKAAFVSPNFFDVLGTQPHEGRVFTAADERSGIPQIVLSYGMWQRVHGGDPSVVGRTLTVVGGRAPRGPRSFTIVGVLPPGFRFTYPEETEAWAMEPWAQVERYPERSLAFYTVGRLKAGVSLATAKARVASIRRTIERPGEPPERRSVASVEPIRDWVIGNTRPPLLLLGAVALLLLLITCLTVSNALFVRLAARQRELAVRAALGANAARLRRELLTQGFALACAGTIAGTVMAVALSPALRASLPVSFPRGDELGPNVWVLGFAAATAGITTILASLAPALTANRVALVGSLRSVSANASSDGATGRWRVVLIAAQGGVATALLIVATLLLVSFWRLGRVPMGFDGSSVLAVQTRVLGTQARDQVAMRLIQRRLLDEIRALPQVAEAGMTTAVPFRGVDFLRSVTRPGDRVRVAPNFRIVDSGYFAVMRIPLRRGRLFTSADDATSRKVVVISDSVARGLFGDADPLGQIIDPDDPMEVVGVVGDVRFVSYDRAARPAIYIPRPQMPEPLMTVVVRLRPGATNVNAAVRGAFQRVDPSIPILSVESIEDVLEESVAGRRFYTFATAAFAIIALALVLSGVAITVSRVVAERQRELAIRTALGASKSQLLAPVMSQGIGAVAAGSTAGVIATLASARLLEAFVFGMPARSPITYAAVVALLAITGGASAFLAGRSATRIAPADVLRAD